MPLWQFMACSKGYRNRVLVQSSQCITTGYYTAYYLANKHPQPPAQLIESLTNKVNHTVHPAKQVDMSAEIARIQRLDAKFAQCKGAQYGR